MSALSSPAAERTPSKGRKTPPRHPPVPRASTPGGPPIVPSLKQLLRAADVLLKPPAAFPSTPPEILPRLKACSKALPKEWRKNTPEWLEDDEMEHVGDNMVNGNEDERSKLRRDQLVFVAGKRCFAITKAMQLCLEKEFWPKDQRGGLEDKDFLLGTADHRLIRLLLSHTTFSYLLPLTTHYADCLPTILHKHAESLSQALEATLKLLKTTTPPAPSAGPSSHLPTAPTAITQNLLSTHLVPVFLSTLILAYTPSISADQYIQLRGAFMQAMHSLAPGHAIATLVNVLKLLVQGRREGVKPNGWVREWPKYPEGIINGLLTAQVRRPGGVRGLMENVLGDTARTDDVTSIEGKRLDHIFNVLVRIPRQVTAEIYYPWLLSELFSMIPLTDASSHHPIAYVNTACYSIQRLWASNRPLIGDWLKNKLHSPWDNKSVPGGALGEKAVAESWEAIQRSLQNTRLLLIHNPTSPEFADFLVGSILPQVFSLHVFLSKRPTTAPKISVVRRKEDPGPVQPQSLRDDVTSVLRTWGKMVEKGAGVKGIWSIVESGTGWAVDENGETNFWESEGEGVRLMVGPAAQHEKDETANIVLPSAVKAPKNEEQQLQELLAAHSKSMPDAPLLCGLIKDIGRPEIACQVILRALDRWRLRTAEESVPSMEDMLHLQLTMQLMTHLGAELFTEPEHMLEWVEQTLHDQTQRLEKEEETSLEEALVAEISKMGASLTGGGSGDADEPDSNRGLVELACQLLSSLEAKTSLNAEELPILYPIISHLTVLSNRSPSTAIRRAAGEATLLLLTHLSTPRDDSDPASQTMATYMQALTLYNDPVLPVRAHGLNMLKDLVSTPDFDRALLPEIVELFMEAIEDEDSFINLNAVQGLSAMVDALGKEVFETLMEIYKEGVDSLRKEWKEEEEDEREDAVETVLRLGESLDQVIDKTGDALGIYANEIIPTLMAVFPDASLPTIVRTSSLSLLTTCARVSYLTVLPWTTDLAAATIDLIQIESVRVSPFKPGPMQTAELPPLPPWLGGKPKKVQLVEDDPVEEDETTEARPPMPWIVDDDPLQAQDSKHPSLRRAALVLLNWTLNVITFKIISHRTLAAQEITLKGPVGEVEMQGGEVPWGLVDRAETVVRYVKGTDVDEVARGHAESVEKMVGTLRTAAGVTGPLGGGGSAEISLEALAEGANAITLEGLSAGLKGLRFK
ncbi:hypothetical protein IAT38_004404 [Cryptococcus sp. DSM 104549]